MSAGFVGPDGVGNANGANATIRQSAWLIEQTNHRSGMPCYVAGLTRQPETVIYARMSLDHNQALWFARQEDGEAFLADLKRLNLLPSAIGEAIEVREHRWTEGPEGR